MTPPSSKPNNRLPLSTPGSGMVESPAFQAVPGSPPADELVASLRQEMMQLFQQHIHNGLLATRVQLFDIIGFIEVVSTIPTATPSSFYGQFKIYTNGGTKRFYWYDSNAQAWDYVSFATGVIATNATSGHGAIPTCAGTPTGVPVNGNGSMVYDTTNNKLYVYNGAWKGVTLA